MLTNTDCTLYNRYKGTFKRTYLPGVFWEVRKGANIITSGMTAADGLSLFIPYSDEYQDPINYTLSPTGWTLAEGDYVIRGNIPPPAPVPIMSEDPEDPVTFGDPPAITDATIKQLKQDHYEMYKITTVDPKLYGRKSMWHWEVGGR